MKQIIKNIAICGLVASAGIFTSCEDFLTIYPTSSIVEEDFWKDKTDLNNAVMGCYKQIVSNEMLTKYIYWGEERSDNFERSTNAPASGQVANIMNANLLPTYDQFDWTPAYKAINYCNKVLAHGPEVIATDEAFSNGDWLPIRAEVTAIRALCHFYLLRTFGEIPYVTEDYNNDSQELKIGQSTQLQVLNNIINDLESVVNDAMVDYGNTIENKGRITRKTINTMLADMYLWRASYKAGNNQPFTKIDYANNYSGETFGTRTETYDSDAKSDYQKCVEYCDKVIDETIAERIKKMNETGENVGGEDIEIELEDLLESNESSSKLGGLLVTTNLNAYRSLFGLGNSDESIFELQVEGTSYNNSMITERFWNIKDNKAGDLTGSVALFEGISTGANTTDGSAVFTKTDYRRWESIRWTAVGQSEFNIGKFTATGVTQLNGSTNQYVTNNSETNLSVTYTMRSVSNLNSNWIVYRMSEVYLMKAEALTQISESADEENLYKAFNYVREVFKRSNPYAYQKTNSTAKDDSLKFESFNTPETLEKLVMLERQREFIGEGKRWYDLVRYALRRGRTTEMLDLLTRKYASNSKAIKAKLATMQSLFSPVYNEDIKNNSLLYQNGVWAVSESSSQTDKIK